MIAYLKKYGDICEKETPYNVLEWFNLGPFFLAYETIWEIQVFNTFFKEHGRILPIKKSTTGT